MDGRFVLTPLLFVPEWLADAVAYWGSKRYLLKPAWLLQAGKGGGGEEDPVGYCVGSFGRGVVCGHRSDCQQGTNTRCIHTNNASRSA